MSKLLMAAALIAGISATVLHAPAQARGGSQHLAGTCQYYKQKAMFTGDERWWKRWRSCMKGNY